MLVSNFPRLVLDVRKIPRLIVIINNVPADALEVVVVHLLSDTTAIKTREHDKDHSLYLSLMQSIADRLTDNNIEALYGAFTRALATHQHHPKFFNPLFVALSRRPQIQNNNGPILSQDFL